VLSFTIGESNDITAQRTLTIGDHNHSNGTGYSIVSGSNNTLGTNSHFSLVVGDTNTTSALHTHALGDHNVVSGSFSFAHGQHHNVSESNQFVIGKYSINDTSSGKLFKIGYGTSDILRKDVFYVDNAGSVFANRIKLGDIQGYSSSSSLKMIVTDESSNELKTAGVTISSTAPTGAPGAGDFIWYVV
jgi:hypothetical protein